MRRFWNPAIDVGAVSNDLAAGLWEPGPTWQCRSIRLNKPPKWASSEQRNHKQEKAAGGRGFLVNPVCDSPYGRETGGG
jgi:hypothetical protein